MNRFVSLLCVLVIFMSACGSNKRLHYKQGRIEDEVVRLRTVQAQQTADIVDMQAKLRQMTGMLEEIEFVARERDSLTPRKIGAVAPGKVAPPPIVPIRFLEQDELSVGDMSLRVGHDLGEGLAALRRGQFRQSLALLEGVERVASSSETKQGLAETLFWKGVCFDGIGDAESALATYHKMATTFPKHTRVPYVLLRQGSALIRIGDAPTARITFQKIVADHPNSDAARLAEQRLRDL